MTEESKLDTGRRGFIGAAGSLAAVSLLGSTNAQAAAQTAGRGSNATAPATGRRRLGALEVSSVGLGVQNMSRTYQTTIPSRPEMLNIIRTAFDRGVTFFDAAEAYGPHEVERILGEGVAPFRDKVVITSKFGWNIDPETGAWRGGPQQPPGPHQARGRGHAQASSHRPHRSPLPASRRPTGPDRRRRRRRQGADDARQGPALGPLGDGTEDAAPRPCGAARQCRSERVLDAVARAGGGGHPALRGARHRLRPVEPARGGVPDRRHRREDAIRRR